MNKGRMAAEPKTNWPDPGVHPVFAYAWNEAVRELNLPLPPWPLLMTGTVGDAIIEAFGQRAGWTKGGRMLLMQLGAALLIRHLLDITRAYRKIANERIFLQSTGLVEAEYRHKVREKQRARDRKRKRAERARAKASRQQGDGDA